MASQKEILQKYNYICQFENNIEDCNDKKAQLVLYTKQLLFSNKIKEKYDKLFLGMNYYQCLLDNKEFNEKYKKADKILILGLNPGGRNKEKDNIEQRCNNADLFKLLAIKECYKKKLNDKKIDFKEKFGIYDYYNQNYKLLERIHANLFWEYHIQNDNDDNQNVKDYNKLYNNLHKDSNDNLINDDFYENGPVCIFGDLLQYSEGTQKEVEKLINLKKDDKYTIIKNIIDIFIDYYKPKMIIITNAYASGLVASALNKEKELIEKNATCDYNYNNTNTKLIFSGMVSGRRIIDKYSKYRLMNTINSVWKEIGHSN